MSLAPSSHPSHTFLLFLHFVLPFICLLPFVRPFVTKTLQNKNFSAEQTIAFRGITRSVFEAGIVRGELDVNEAFQEFTERVLSLAGEPDTTSTTTTTTPDHSASNESSVTALTSGGCLSTDGGGGGKGEGGGGGSSAAETRRASGKNPPKVVADSKAKETAVGPKLAGKGSALASVSHGGESGRGGETNSVGSECSGSGSGGGDGSGSGSSGGGGSAGAGPVFSVGDVAAITLFVARGLYRNFGLYRMCFERPAKHRTDIREVQVETPLEPPPLHEAEPIALA